MVVGGKREKKKKKDTAAHKLMLNYKDPHETDIFVCKQASDCNTNGNKTTPCQLSVFSAGCCGALLTALH